MRSDLADYTFCGTSTDVVFINRFWSRIPAIIDNGVETKALGRHKNKFQYQKFLEQLGAKKKCSWGHVNHPCQSNEWLEPKLPEAAGRAAWYLGDDIYEPKTKCCPKKYLTCRRLQPKPLIGFYILGSIDRARMGDVLSKTCFCP